MMKHLVIYLSQEYGRRTEFTSKKLRDVLQRLMIAIDTIDQPMEVASDGEHS